MSDCIAPDLLVITGSRLYGYATPQSDVDHRGFYVPTPREYLSLNKPPILTAIEGSLVDDCQIHPLESFIKDLYRANAQHLELLFAPSENILRLSTVGQTLINHRDLFVTDRILASIRGFAFSEKRRCQGQGLEVKFAKKDDQVVFEQFYGHFQVTGYVRNQIYDLIYAERNDDPRHIVSTHKACGAKRQEQFDKYGYDLKSAVNYLRLLFQGLELARTKKLTFPRPASELEIYKMIRLGDVSLDSVLKIGQETEVLLEALIKAKPLAKPDFDKINNLYYQLARAGFGEQE